MKQTVNIEPISALKDNYIWAIVDLKNHSALIVDPGVAEPVREFLKRQNLSLAGIVLTHHHPDHTNGVADLKNWYNAPVYGPAAIKGVTEPVSETFTPQHFPLSFNVLPIPGHTLEHTAYYSPDILFSGDTLFAAGCGRLFEGTPQQMLTALQTLSHLPQTTRVYCGHEYTLNNLRFAESVEPSNTAIQKKIVKVTSLRNQGLPSLPSTIQEEKDTNPFLRYDQHEVIASASAYARRALKTPLEVFTVLRDMKDNW